MRGKATSVSGLGWLGAPLGMTNSTRHAADTKLYIIQACSADKVYTGALHNRGEKALRNGTGSKKPRLGMGSVHSGLYPVCSTALGMVAAAQASFPGTACRYTDT